MQYTIFMHSAHSKQFPQDNTVTSKLSLSNVDWEDAGYYYCEGSYSQGTVTSTPAKVFVRGNVCNCTVLLGLCLTST